MATFVGSTDRPTHAPLKGCAAVQQATSSSRTRQVVLEA
jgi:hypothetical protein